MSETFSQSEGQTESTEDKAKRIAVQAGRQTHVGVDEIQEILMSSGLQQLGIYAENDSVEVTTG